MMNWRDWLPTHGEQGGYVGPLSTYQEWHALGHGLYDGLRSLRPSAGGLPENTDVQAEPHMYKTGFLLSTVSQVAVGVIVLAVVFG